MLQLCTKNTKLDVSAGKKQHSNNYKFCHLALWARYVYPSNCDWKTVTNMNRSGFSIHSEYTVQSSLQPPVQSFIQCESKKPPSLKFLSDIFSKRLRIFNLNFPIYNGLQIFINYLQRWRSYAILSATTIITITITITAEFYIAPPTKWTGALNNKSYAYEWIKLE